MTLDTVDQDRLIWVLDITVGALSVGVESWMRDDVVAEAVDETLEFE